MTLLSKDHYELMDMFERQFADYRLDREDKALWPQGNVYQSGETNALFLAYRHGVAYGRATYAQPPPHRKGRDGRRLRMDLTDYERDLLRHLSGEDVRSEEHTSELQSLKRKSYAVIC